MLLLLTALFCVCACCCMLLLQSLAAQQGISWDEVKRAAEASQHATQVAAQPAQQPAAAAGGCTTDLPCKHITRLALNLQVLYCMCRWRLHQCLLLSSRACPSRAAK